MSRRYDLKHIKISVPAPMEYKAPKSMGENKIPIRDRKAHADLIKKEFIELSKSIEHLKQERKKQGYDADGALITVKGKKEYDLMSDSLQNKKENIEVVNYGETKLGEPYAIVRLPKGEIGSFIKKINEYEKKDRPKTGKPYHNDLLSSIEKVSNSLVDEFWVGDESYFPNNIDENVWWEIWILGGKEDQVKANQMRNESIILRKEKI